MPAEAKAKIIPAKRRGWFKRLLRWSLWTLLVIVVLHRPILHFAGRRIAIWFAAREHMALDLRLGGNMWSRIEILDLSLHADGTGPAPIERLKVDRLAVEYDLWKVIHAEWPHAVRRVEVGAVDGAMAIHAPDDPNDPQTPIAKTFGELLSKSLSPVEQLSVGRVDFEVKDVAAIRGLTAKVSNREPGHIGWEKIHVVGFPDIGEARAELVTSESSIAISKLPLLPQIVVSRISLNHVTGTMPRGGLEILIEAGGGTAGLRVEPSLTQGALDVSVDVESVRLNEVAQPFGVELPSPAAIESFHMKATGAPEDLETSTADASFVLRMDEKALLPSALVRGQAKWGRGMFRITELSAVASGVELSIGGELNVPLHELTPAKLTGEISWKLSAPDLTTVHLRDTPPITGSLTGAGRLVLEKGEAVTTGDIETKGVSRDSVRADSAIFHIDARRKITGLSDILATLTANLSFDVKGVTVNDVRLDSISLKGTMDGQRVGVADFTVASGENRMTGTLRTTLKPDTTGFASAPEMDLHLDVPNLENFGVVVNGADLTGKLNTDGKLRLEGDRLTGTMTANGTDILLGKTPVGGFRAQVKFEDGAAILESLNVGIAEAGEMTVSGRIALTPAMDYSGELHLNLANLAKLDALLATAGQPAKLGGTLTLDWTGDGKIADNTHSGKLRFLGKNMRRDSVTVSEVRLGATYSPGQFETDELLVAADKTRLTARVQWKGERLDVAALSVSLAGQELVTGSASIPLAPANPGGALQLDQPVSLQLTGRNADIAKILSGAMASAPVSGNVSFDLAVSGTLAKPEVKFSTAAHSLKSAKAASVAPADVDVKVAVSGSRLTIDAIAKQRDIQPITVTASLPFDMEKIRTQPALLRELPLSITVKLPASSLATLPRFVPGIARMDGTVAADVTVAGTVAKPVVSGEVIIATKSVRLSSESLPPISNFTTKLTFRDDTITLQNTRGEIGGGTFNLDGKVNLAKLDQPVFDLRLRSNKVLVLRDESITVRADADVTLAGPLKAATAAGTVYVTQSRFLKDVDILPLTLPGKPKPQVKTVAAPVRVSFPNPPLRDWKFDIAIKTREKDSFLVRGNLAKGSSAMDLRLGGTGLNPFLTGQIEIENFTALLPVSKMEVKRGTVTFSEENPFQPQLDVQAESRIGKNTVLMNISGSATAPHLELESEPPLPQKDIISLLATGTTSGEIGSNASVLATRTALLKVKQWYKKTFRKNADEPEKQDALMDRFDVDVGNVDPKTGRPDVSTSVRFTDNLYFIGEIGLEGQFTGKMKYLLRFR